MILLLLISVLTLILYFVRKFGYLDLIICLVLIIIAYGTYMPDTLKHYVFFQLHLNEALIGIPTEIMNSEKIKALSDVNNLNVGQVLSNLTNNILDVLSQQPIDTSEQLHEQTKILTNIDQKLEIANTINEVALEQYSVGQKIELQQLNSLEKSIAYQTEKLHADINNPKGVLNSLNSINQNTQANINIYGELQKNNMNSTQTNKILTEGFKSWLQAENKSDLANQIKNLGNSFETNFVAYQNKVDGSIQAIQKNSVNELAEAKQNFDQSMREAELKINLAEQEKEQAVKTASDMVDQYRKHENLGVKSDSKLNFTAPENTVDNTVKQTAAGISLLTIAVAILSFIF